MSIALDDADTQFMRAIRRGNLIIVEEFATDGDYVHIAQTSAGMRGDQSRRLRGERVKCAKVESVRQTGLFFVVLANGLTPIVKGQIAAGFQRQ